MRGEGKYVIEQKGADGWWFIIGHDHCEGWAQHYAARHVSLFPDAEVRVRERVPVGA